MITKNDLALAHDLRQAVKRLHRHVRKQIRDVCQWSEAEESVMRMIIERTEVSPSELCSALGLSSQFTSQVLNRLEGLECIVRKPSSTDKRKSLVSLSAKGRATVDNMKHQTDEWMAKGIEAKFTKTQKEALKQAVEMLTQLTDI